MSSAVVRRRLTFLLTVWLSHSSNGGGGGAFVAAVSSPLEQVMHQANFSDDEIHRVLQRGELVKAVVESANNREIAVKFAVLANITPQRFLQLYLTSEKRKELNPDLMQLGHLSGDGTLEDFAELKLLEQLNAKQTVKDYLNAAPGVDLNLSLEEIQSFQALNDDIDTTISEAHDDHVRKILHAIKEMLLKRYRSYKSHGLKGILPYQRAAAGAGRGGSTYDPGVELLQKSKFGSMAAILREKAPSFYKYLLEYPNHRPDGLQDSFTFMNFSFEKKPMFSLVHRMGMVIKDDDVDKDEHAAAEDQHHEMCVFLERQFYNSRNSNSVQAVGCAFPCYSSASAATRSNSVDNMGHTAPANNTKPSATNGATQTRTVLIYVARASTDQVLGFGGSAKRAIGARVMSSQYVSMMERFRNSKENRKSEL